MVLSAIEDGANPRDLYGKLIWPAMEKVDTLFREDLINTATEHMATRINRTVADQLQTRMARTPPDGKRIIITCADGEGEEFSAQMCADLFEAGGWDVYLLGGGVPHDEIGSLVGALQPRMLVIVGSRPTDAPSVRQLIDYVREINACPTMTIMVSGGVFNRAAGLWREVKSDLFAETAAEALELADRAEPRKPEIRLPGAPKKRRRRRRPPLLVQADSGES
jgi:methanogenic corrinoid protein MtbC1